MAFNHSLCSKEGLDLVSEFDNIAILLTRCCVSTDDKSLVHADTHPQPFRALGTEAEALKSQTNTGLAMSVNIRLFVAFLQYGTSSACVCSITIRWLGTNLATDSARVATRLSADRAFSLRRSGFLSRG